MKFWATRVCLAGFLLIVGGGLAAQDAGESSAAKEAESQATDAPIESEKWFPETTARNLTVSRGWLPVYLELTTLRAGTQYVEIEGAVLASDGGRDGNVAFEVRRRVEVSPGAPKKVWLYLHFDSNSEDAGEAQTARVRIYSGETRIDEAKWDVFTISGQRQFVSIPIWTSGENTEFAQFQLGTSAQTKRQFDLLRETVDES